MSAKRYLALDIGGTKIEAGLVNGDGAVLKTPHRESARPGCPRDYLLADLDSALSPFLVESAEGLGVGFPGLLNPVTGVISQPSRSVFPALENFALRVHLETEYGVPVETDNDANMYALGVYHFGGGSRYTNVAVLTLGTNLGVGIIQRGHLERGPDAMPERARQLLDRWTGWIRHNGGSLKQRYGADGETLYSRARRGDQPARSALDALGRDIAETVSKICRMYSLEAIFLGGGVAKSYEFFYPALEQQLLTYGVDADVRTVTIPYPALAGAAAMFER